MKILTKSFTLISFVLLTTVLISCEDEKHVIGLNGSAKYGYIKVTFNGIRPDGEPLNSTAVFRFMPEEGPGFSSYYQDGNFYFDVQRMSGAVNESHNSNFATLDLVSDDENVLGADVYFQTYLLFSDRYAMQLSHNASLPLEDITSYNFDAETGKLKMTYTTIVLAANNSTGNDLTITGVVNVTVMKGLNGPIGD